MKVTFSSCLFSWPACLRIWIYSVCRENLCVYLSYELKCYILTIDWVSYLFLLIFPELKAYYSNSMPLITCQPSCRQDVAPSVLEANAISVTLANEWENEWNQSGLASRLSKEVCGLWAYCSILWVIRYGKMSSKCLSLPENVVVCSYLSPGHPDVFLAMKNCIFSPCKSLSICLQVKLLRNCNKNVARAI